MSTNASAGNKSAGTAIASILDDQQSERCRNCGAELVDGDAWQTAVNVHKEVHCAGCGHSGLLTEPRGAGIVTRHGQVFGAVYGGGER